MPRHHVCATERPAVKHMQEWTYCRITLELRFKSSQDGRLSERVIPIMTTWVGDWHHGISAGLSRSNKF